MYNPVLRIHLILMRIRIRTGKKWIRVISLRFYEFLAKNNLQIFCFIFSLIFILKLNEPFRNEEICIISLSFKSSDLGFRSKDFFLQFLVDFLPLGSGSVDPHIFADVDPGNQNLVDPTDPDPKHWKIS